jgi:hypothetical protein
MKSVKRSENIRSVFPPSLSSSRTHYLPAKVIHRPSIGKTKALQEPKAWESLLSPSAKSIPRSTSTPSLRTSSSTASLVTLDSEMSLPPAKVPHLLQAVTAATQERRTFAIDEAKDDDEEVGGADAGAEDDAGVMDEVCTSLYLRTSVVLLNTFCLRWMLSSKPTTPVLRMPIKRWPRNF